MYTDAYDSAEENDDKGRILIPFNNLINDTYCRDISLRVRSHLDVKRKEGQFIGSFAGYGYRKDPKDKNHLIIVCGRCAAARCVHRKEKDPFGKTCRIAG